MNTLVWKGKKVRKSFDTTIKALESSIRLRQLRQNVINANIANADTPGYNAKKLDFEDALKRAIELEHFGDKSSSGSEFAFGDGSISSVKADVYDNPEINYANDKNTVDMEKEIAALNENSILHKAATQLINKKLAALKYSATEGGR